MDQKSREEWKALLQDAERRGLSASWGNPSAVLALLDEIERAESRGYERAREQAAGIMERWPGLSDTLFTGEYEDCATRAARRIRAMTDERASEAEHGATPDLRPEWMAANAVPCTVCGVLVRWEPLAQAWVHTTAQGVGPLHAGQPKK